MLKKLQSDFKYNKIKFNDFDTLNLSIKNNIYKLIKYNLNKKKIILLLGDNTYLYKILYYIKFYNKNAICIIINIHIVVKVWSVNWKATSMDQLTDQIFTTL